MTELEFKNKVKRELQGLAYLVKHAQVVGYDQVYINSATVLITKYASEVKRAK
jgi:hypothetical protein